jgi:uncharacterized protein YprB with RNaseH-like and TPR domain
MVLTGAHAVEYRLIEYQPQGDPGSFTNLEGDLIPPPRQSQRYAPPLGGLHVVQDIEGRLAVEREEEIPGYHAFTAGRSLPDLCYAGGFPVPVYM